MPSSLAFLNATVAPAGDISDQPLQPAVPSEHPGCDWDPESVVAPEEGPVLALCPLQVAGLGLWPEGKCRATALFWATRTAPGVSLRWVSRSLVPPSLVPQSSPVSAG